MGDVVALPESQVAAIDNKELAGGSSGPRDAGMERASQNSKPMSDI